MPQVLPSGSSQEGGQVARRDNSLGWLLQPARGGTITAPDEERRREEKRDIAEADTKRENADGFW